MLSCLRKANCLTSTSQSRTSYSISPSLLLDYQKELVLPLCAYKSPTWSEWCLSPLPQRLAHLRVGKRSLTVLRKVSLFGYLPATLIWLHREATGLAKSHTYQHRNHNHKKIIFYTQNILLLVLFLITITIVAIIIITTIDNKPCGPKLGGAIYPCRLPKLQPHCRENWRVTSDSSITCVT